MQMQSKRIVTLFPFEKDQGYIAVWCVGVAYDEICSLSQRWPRHPSALGLLPPRTDVGHIWTASCSVLSRKSAKAGWSSYRNKRCNMLVTSVGCREIFLSLEIVEKNETQSKQVCFGCGVCKKRQERKWETLKCELNYKYHELLCFSAFFFFAL